MLVNDQIWETETLPPRETGEGDRRLAVVGASCIHQPWMYPMNILRSVGLAPSDILADVCLPHCMGEVF